MNTQIEIQEIDGKQSIKLIPEIITKPKNQIITLKVESPNQRLPIYVQTKQEHDFVKGIFATISDADGQINSTLQLDVDNEEIFPEGFEISLITASEFVNINETPYRFTEKAKTSYVKGMYVDGGNAIKYPYFVRLYLVTEVIVN